MKFKEQDELAIKISKMYDLSMRQAIKAEEWAFLYRTVLDNKYRSILEIGSYNHFSSSAFLEALGDIGYLVSIDISYPNLDTKYKQPNWIKIQGSSHDVLPNFKNKFDLILIDGDHSTSAVRKDIKDSLNLIADGGQILMHDSNYPPTRKAITEELGKEVEFWSFKPMKFHGFGIWHKKS